MFRHSIETSRMKSLELIRNNQADLAFRKLYKSFPQVKRYIRKNSGTKMDAEDIFQQALYVFYEKVQDHNFKLDVEAEAYVFSVSKYLWANQLRKQGKEISVPSTFGQAEEDQIDHIKNKEKQLNKIEQVINDLGEKCREILSLFYYKSKSLQEIAQEMNYSSTNAIKTRKYKCLEKARKMVQS